MFIRIFANAIDKEDALKHAKEFENIVSNGVVDIKIMNVEQYWKIPEEYCVEFEFTNVVPERLIEVMKELGNNPHVITDDGKIEEYIFARTAGEIYLEKIQWILINVSL